MTMILDVAKTISSPDSMFLFDDTSHQVVHYAPRVWRLNKVNGQAQIQYNEWPAYDIAFMQIIMAPFIADNELVALKAEARTKGITVQPVRYLGKNESGLTGTNITVPYSFPPDPRFRFEINGGQGGSFANPIPVVFSTNLLVGRMLRDLVSDNTQPLGLVFQISSWVRGATTTFHAIVHLDYDRTYELLSLHASVSWWVWSSDWQAAWQELQTLGAVTVEILGGTADQKAIAYKMAEWLRDMFMKAELGNVTQATHPDSGIIRTSLRYDHTHAHTRIDIEFNEREFTDAPYASPAFTGAHHFAHPVTELATDSAAADSVSDVLLRTLLDGCAARGSRVEYDEFPVTFFQAAKRMGILGGSDSSTRKDHG
jgi:hypothetical protein